MVRPVSPRFILSSTGTLGVFDLQRSALPDGLEEHDSGGNRYVQRAYRASRRDRNQEVAPLANQFVQSLAFAA